MSLAASCHRATVRRGLDNRGSTLAAALALAFLVFVITVASVACVATSYEQISTRHKQAAALFLAEAGVQKAGQSLLSNARYTGERGTKLTTGRFNVLVVKGDGGYVVTSTGYVDSPFKRKPKKTVWATIRLNRSETFSVTDWKENP